MTVVRRFVAAALAAVLATGCMSFNGKELPRYELRKPARRTAVVALEVGEFRKTFRGREGDLGDYNKGLAVRTATSQIPRIWKSKGLIKDFGYPGDLDEPATHRITVGGTINEDSSIAGAVLTGLTLYLVPSVSRMTYDLDVRLDRLAGDRVVAGYRAHAKNSFSLWQWIVFLPTSIFGSVVWGSYAAERDRALYLYEQFRKQGAFDGGVSAPEPAGVSDSGESRTEPAPDDAAESPAREP